ncbi:MAG: helix-turn-helix transcriptional regulator [Dehalococcoidia bacterium]|nr:helix-turn-helix transcriptional regulator [Dehalococcoidia bacterium]MYA52058.1 helix-turn-helix transcriptional regulator [Dehalococcoidia bacterium]
MPERRRGRPPHPDLLTPAERRVLEELRKGGTNAEIAVRIGVGPETVKTHVSNMLAKLELEDRNHLAAWREEDAPRRRRWALTPFLLRPLVAVGVVAGAAVVVVAILVLLALVRDEQMALYIEGVGWIDGPVAIVQVGELTDTGGRYRLAALDLPTGKRWFLDGVGQVAVGDRLVAWNDESIRLFALAPDRLVAWNDESIQFFTLGDQVDRVLFRSDEPFSAPIVSPCGDLIAFTLLPLGPEDIGTVVVIDLHTGEEVLRLPGDDPRIPPHQKLALERWSTDGDRLLVAATWSTVLTAAHLVLGLDGSVYVFAEEVGRTSEFAFSPDLRYVVRGGLPSPENYDSDALVALEDGPRLSGPRSVAKSWVESLTIVEVDTGQELAVVLADEGNVLAHIVGPVDGRILYDTVPVSELSLGYAEGLVSTWYEARVSHVFNLAAGTAIPMDQLDRNLRDAIALAWSREDRVDYLASIGHCLETLSTPTACDSAYEMYDRIRRDADRETNRETIWRLFGVVWLD